MPSAPPLPRPLPTLWGGEVGPSRPLAATRIGGWGVRFDSAAPIAGNGSTCVTAPRSTAARGHTVDDATLLALGDGNTALGADQAQTLRTILAHSGQQNPQHFSGPSPCGGAKQHIDTRSVTLGGLGRESDHHRGADPQVHPGRRNEHLARLQPLAFHRFLDGQSAESIEPVGEGRVNPGGHVLHDGDGQGKIRR